MGQVYNVGKENAEGTVQVLLENLTTWDYTTDEGEALEYNSSPEAASIATYAYNTTGIPHVVVGPHPKPHA